MVVTPFPPEPEVGDGNALLSACAQFPQASEPVTLLDTMHGFLAAAPQRRPAGSAEEPAVSPPDCALFFPSHEDIL